MKVIDINVKFQKDGVDEVADIRVIGCQQHFYIFISSRLLTRKWNVVATGGTCSQIFRYDGIKKEQVGKWEIKVYGEEEYAPLFIEGILSNTVALGKIERALGLLLKVDGYEEYALDYRLARVNDTKEVRRELKKTGERYSEAKCIRCDLALIMEWECRDSLESLFRHCNIEFVHVEV